MFSAPDTKTDTKIQAILAAAWAGFSAYGFRKTSMDDIARGAGMSRPALYLHFKNKEAIFRSLVESYYAEAAREVAAAPKGGGAPGAASGACLCGPWRRDHGGDDVFGTWYGAV